MKKVSTKGSLREEEMRPECDFSSMKRAVRGKYYKAYRSGHKVEIHRADGTTSVQHFKLEEGAVLLAPDVKKYFPNSEAVNKALRSLIEIIPSKRRMTAHIK
ncbi:MAG: hypothetical protein A3D13_03670 [Planctomycetes bacterium RIFCSPHIGHO2_02_FULL_40_12]|nr:MAG: hypothetical protein A3D13_03670 [Planctomycetes bacterium RIFCSPHIGHO2_02_FULL_40_12]